MAASIAVSVVGRSVVHAALRLLVRGVVRRGLRAPAASPAVMTRVTSVGVQSQSAPIKRAGGGGEFGPGAAVVEEPGADELAQGVGGPAQHGVVLAWWGRAHPLDLTPHCCRHVAVGVGSDRLTQALRAP